MLYWVWLVGTVSSDKTIVNQTLSKSRLFSRTGHQMKNQKDVLNKFIPADDLYWDKHEGKYITHSEEEINDIITSCIKNNITEQNDIMKVFHWCTSVRVGELLMKGFLTGNVHILGIDKDGEPIFGQSLPEEDNQPSDD